MEYWARRVVVGRRCRGQVSELYRQRADTENVFDELKHRWGAGRFLLPQG